MMLNFRNIVAFWISTLPTTLGISLLPLLFAGTGLFLICFSTFGFAFSIAIKENRQQEYIFYLNNGLSKLELIRYVFFLNLIAGAGGVAIIEFIINCFD